MARPKGSKNKSNSTTEAQHGPGHNSAALTDAELQALHFRHVKEMKDASEAVNSAVAVRRNIIKRIKSEGGNLASIKLSIALETPEGEDKIKENMAEILRIARWNGLDPGFQGNLFEASDMTPAADRAAANGLRAGMKGERADCPHDLSTPQGQAYMENYHKGQELLLKSGIKRPEPEDDGGKEGGDGFDDALDGKEEPLPREEWTKAMQESSAEGDAHIKRFSEEHSKRGNRAVAAEA